MGNGPSKRGVDDETKQGNHVKEIIKSNEKAHLGDSNNTEKVQMQRACEAEPRSPPAGHDRDTSINKGAFNSAQNNHNNNQSNSNNKRDTPAESSSKPLSFTRSSEPRPQSLHRGIDSRPERSNSNINSTGQGVSSGGFNISKFKKANKKAAEAEIDNYKYGSGESGNGSGAENTNEIKSGLRSESGNRGGKKTLNQSDEDLIAEILGDNTLLSIK